MLNELKITDFDKVYALLKDSFPTDEIRPYELQKDLFKKDAYKVYATDGIKAIIAVYDLDEVLFVEHFAVNPDCRNQGIGAKMLSELIKMPKKTVCLEVEPPETDMAKRRISFYERNGFFLNDYYYIQPPMAEGQNELELKLMTYGKKVNKAEFEKIKNTLYKEVYNLY